MTTHHRRPVSRFPDMGAPFFGLYPVTGGQARKPTSTPKTGQGGHIARIPGEESIKKGLDYEGGRGGLREHLAPCVVTYLSHFYNLSSHPVTVL